MRASETDRFVVCPASLVRPRVRARLDDGTDAEAAAWGHVAHRWAATGEVPSGPLGELLERKLLLARVEREALWPAGGHHEHSFALRLETGEVTWGPEGADADHDVWKSPWPAQDYLTGTIDWWGYVEGRLLVDDLKTGRRWLWSGGTRGADGRMRGGEKHLHYDPWAMGQLTSYALAVRNGTRTTSGTIDVSVTQWERYPLDGEPQRDLALRTVEDLSVHLERLRWVRASGDLARPGEDQCRFCECGPGCPEGRAVNARRIAERHAALLED